MDISREGKVNDVRLKRFYYGILVKITLMSQMPSQMSTTSTIKRVFTKGGICLQ